MELSAGGWPVWEGQFTPFGQEIVNAAPLLPGQPDGSSMHYKFTGKERDSESGLDYFGARYYASSMGRWMSPDWSAEEEPVPYAKLDNPQSLDLYSYVWNNPLTGRDADGHAGESPYDNWKAAVVAHFLATKESAVQSYRAVETLGKFLSENPQFSFATAGYSDVNNIGKNLTLMTATDGVGEIPELEVAIKSFGFREMESLEGLVAGKLSSGAVGAFEFSKTGDQLSIGISVISKISAETYRGIQEGAVLAAEAIGSKSVRIEARMVTNEKVANSLTSRGFKQEIGANGKATSNYYKVIKLVKGSS